MKNAVDLTQGSVGKKVIRFAFPIILANLIQAIYGIVDMVTVGQFIGPSGMSAVSMGAQITTVVLVIVNGLSSGGTIISAQLTGHGKNKEVSYLFGTLLTFFAILAVIISAVVMLLARPLLRVINTPDAAFTQAVQYLLICMAGTIFVYAYNSMAALLRGVGNSKTPMIIVLTTVILNAFLDVLLVAVIPLGVVGAALATIICQFISVVMIWIYIKTKTDLFDFKLRSFHIHREYLKLVVKIGLPQAIQFAFASSSFVLMSSLVNIYGVDASAAAGAAAKVQTIANLPAQGMMAGLLTVTAQNLAIKEPKRVLKGMFTGMAFVTAISAVIFALCMLFPTSVFRIFTTEASVAKVGTAYLRCMAFSFIMESIMFSMFGVISGAGYTPVTMCCGILSGFAVRYCAAFVLSRVLELGFNGIGLAYLAGPVVSMIISFTFLLTGKWKTPKVQLK